jgi:hypothetical protein
MNIDSNPLVNQYLQQIPHSLSSWLKKEQFLIFPDRKLKKYSALEYDNLLITILSN